MALGSCPAEPAANGSSPRSNACFISEISAAPPGTLKIPSSTTVAGSERAAMQLVTINGTGRPDAAADSTKLPPNAKCLNRLADLLMSTLPCSGATS